MNLRNESAKTTGRSNADLKPETSKHGRWISFARPAWVVLTLLILMLNIAALPHYDAALQRVCAAPAYCFGDQLTSARVQSLQSLGVSTGAYAAVYAVIYGISVLVWVLLGALLFWRRSDEPMALFCSFMLVLFGGASIVPVLEEGLAPLSLGWYTLVNVLWFIGQVCFVLFFYLFPTGRFVPRWTRWIVLPLTGYYVREIITENTRRFTPLSALVFFVLILTTVVAQVYRFRRVSTTRQRQQTKWVVFAFVLVIVGFISLYIVGQLILIRIFAPQGDSSSVVVFLIGLVATTVLNTIFLLIPFSIAIAILRSRLWDIDIIINRTLVYATLTAILALVYVGLIFALQYLLRGIISQNNDVAIVVSTLAIAALFQPLRHRIQAIIDRRFYRRKYDAAKIVETFSATLRNEVDLNQLREHLISVVQDTMQPAHVSLWLRKPNSELPRSDRIPPR
jgi:hypothetical protein